MTKEEKEVLLTLAYGAAYYARYQENKLKELREVGDRARARDTRHYLDQANGREEQIVGAITRLYTDTGRSNTLDLKEMVAALNKVGKAAREDADAKDKKTPRELRQFIHSIDVDDDEDAADGGDCK